MKNYKITIITVTKNSEKFLEKNIKSVLSQSYKNYEHIIIDGNSVDKTKKIIKSFKKKVKFINNKNDKGLYHAMNVGIKNSKGDIIGILNSDDMGHQKKISRWVEPQRVCITTIALMMKVTFWQFLTENDKWQRRGGRANFFFVL